MPLSRHWNLRYLFVATHQQQLRQQSVSVTLSPCWADGCHSPCVHSCQDILANLKNTKASGSLDLPVDVLKQFGNFISPPLTHLINQSLVTGIVPQNMKIASISPIFKTGLS